MNPKNLSSNTPHISSSEYSKKNLKTGRHEIITVSVLKWNTCFSIARIQPKYVDGLIYIVDLQSSR